MSGGRGDAGKECWRGGRGAGGKRGWRGGSGRGAGVVGGPAGGLSLEPHYC